jgi:chorismate dehydratase
LNSRLRVAAISFLNPAPLMWDFDHLPRCVELAQRYEVHRTQPALCAEELLTGRADLGLIPVASLTESLAIVPGCAIASLKRVRSIQLIIRLRGIAAGNTEEALKRVRTVAVDTASRSSVAYTQVLFQRFLGTLPEFMPHPANLVSMLAVADAALLIGDPALLALEDRNNIERLCGPCLWLDVAEQWIARTGLPWVAAVWAVRREALGPSKLTAQQLIHDLQSSRDAGIANAEHLAHEWAGRIAVPEEVIRAYLTQNIYYHLAPECVESIRVFRAYAAELGVLPTAELRLL